MTAGREKVRRFKDPVYGYIDVPVRICALIVDTPEFQRLRRIVQTSFAPVYPSALHNRFVHSLGVYHLGCLVAESLDVSLRDYMNDSERDSELLSYWEDALSTFKLACLLHDFGHAPFSHAGERLYREYPKGAKDDTGYTSEIDVSLANLVGSDGSEGFETTQSAVSAAAHEVMSALLALERFSDIIPNHELFARCITGYKHPDDRGHLTRRDELDNILVSLLNSETIDVDRLDYLIRDAQTIGFESISIDYVRLLRSARIVWKNRRPYFAFHKAALSVLENVIYARDLEKKWIQSHPVIAYEQFLVKHMTEVVNDYVFEKGGRLFSKESLTRKGLELEDGRRIRLMSDDDIVYLAKQKMDEDSLIEEYFDRSRRRHPIWKSESEYRMLFGVSAASERLNKGVNDFAELLKRSGAPFVLNPNTMALLCEDDEERNGDSPWFDSDARMTAPLNLMEGLGDLAEHENVELDYVLLTQGSFESGFGADSLQTIPIVFEDAPEVEWHHFRDVSSVLDVEGSGAGYFYLYHRRASEEGFPREKLVDILRSAF